MVACRWGMEEGHGRGIIKGREETQENGYNQHIVAMVLQMSNLSNGTL